MSERTDTAVALRPMTAVDVVPMAELEARVSPEPWSQALFEGELGVVPAERYWVVAETADARDLIGFAGMMFVVDGTEVIEGHVMNVAVDPDWRRQRVARRLIHALITEARSRGALSLTLEVRTDNGPARALYRRFGFAPVGTRPSYYGDGADALVMWVHDVSGFAYGERLARLVSDEVS